MIVRDAHTAGPTQEARGEGQTDHVVRLLRETNFGLNAFPYRHKSSMEWPQFVPKRADFGQKEFMGQI